MSNRLRFAVVGSAFAGMLLVASYQAWQRRPGALREHYWGNVRGDGVLNAVRSVDEFDTERGRFSYYTGARSGDAGPLTAAPTYVLAAAAHGSVSVRLLAFDGYEHARADEEALELARIVSAATTNVFPAAAIPVEIDLHFMPEGARFSLAKRVDWREGRPYALALFAREQKLNRSTPAHELYHVLTTRWSLRSAPEATHRPGAASSYAEAAADLYAACGQLLANETLPRPEPSNDRVTITDPGGDQVFHGALVGDELVVALSLMHDGANGKGVVGFGPLLAATVFEQVFGEATAIMLDSLAGTTLLALCKDASANPFALEAWFARTGPTAGGADDQVRGSVTPR